jgi:hypothetical protein
MYYLFSVDFGGYSFLATKTRKHGISPKNLKKKAFVGFSAFVLWWLYFFCHKNTEARNFTKKSQKESFCGF